MQTIIDNLYFKKISTILKQPIYLLLTISIACLLYKILEYQSLKNSSALFIGIPLFMAITLAYTSSVKYLTLNVLGGLSLGLIASFHYLNEGSFCVPMTAPLFLLIGLIVCFTVSRLRLSNYNKVYLIPLLFLTLMSFEGISSNTSLDRAEQISVSRETTLSMFEIEQLLKQNRQFTKLPFLLSWGFPQPQYVTGSGSNVGDIREIHFNGGEGEPGDAQFQITERSENSLTFSKIKDTSHINHWLKWKSSNVSWVKGDTGKTTITWQIDYERQLDPSWYFGPLQRYAVALAAEALIDNMIMNPKL